MIIKHQTITANKRLSTKNVRGAILSAAMGATIFDEQYSDEAGNGAIENYTCTLSQVGVPDDLEIKVVVVDEGTHLITIAVVGEDDPNNIAESIVEEIVGALS